MPVGSEVIVCGEFRVSWNSVALGIMRGDDGVPTLEQVTKAQAIDNTSAYGKSTIDAVYQGADWFAQFICEEYKPGTIAAWWPFGAMGRMGVIGRLYWNLAAPLVLTAIAGTPAAASPATLTASKAILAPGYNTRLLYGPMVREVPIRQILLPYDVGSPSGTVGWYTET